jgi:hypothetical protein
VVGDRRHERDRDDDHDRRDERGYPQRFGDARRERAPVRELRDAFRLGAVHEHERDQRRARPEHDERAVGGRERGVTQRAESGEAEHHHRDAAGRQ